MKRSEINAAIQRALRMLEANHLRLPPFGYWDMAAWRERLPGLENLRKAGLGWDVTDFGGGDFARRGSVLFTVRNGVPEDAAWGTPYAEKLIFQLHEAEQEIPFHYHSSKTEDIINRGGGILALELYNSTADGQRDEATPVRVRMDGMDCTIRPGAPVYVEKGASITLTSGLFHRFYAKKGEGDLVVGEVSSINDDEKDNTFLERLPRFATIEEDEPALVPLCNEYEGLLA